jgi:hypothetical protein
MSYVGSTVKLHPLAAWRLQSQAEPVQQPGTATPGDLTPTTAITTVCCQITLILFRHLRGIGNPRILAVCRREVVGLPKCGLAGYSETVRPVPHFWIAQAVSALRQLGV